MLIGAFPSRAFVNETWPDRGWPGYATAVLPTGGTGLAYSDQVYARLWQERDDEETCSLTKHWENSKSEAPNLKQTRNHKLEAPGKYEILRTGRVCTSTLTMRRRLFADVFEIRI